MRIDELGGLKVRITGGTDREGSGAGPVVVLLHGFGATGEDLVPLSRVIRAPPGTRFVFPEAPLSLESVGYGAGRAWWMIDLARLQRRRDDAEVIALMSEIPEGLAGARARVVAMLDDIDEKLRPSGVVLGGFSQGAMLSCDVALRAARPLAGLVLLSGALIAEPEWGPLMPARRGLPVLQSHGRADPILPFEAADRLRDQLTKAQLEVTWLPFHGEHEIPPLVIDRLGTFLERTLAPPAAATT